MIVTTRNALCSWLHRIPVSKLRLALLCLLPCMLAMAQPSSLDGNRGYAGIVFAQENNAELLKAFGLTHGAIIVKVVKDSPAQNAGIRPDDVILSINGTPVNSPNDLSASLSRMPVGTPVELTFDRDGKSFAASLRLAPAAEVFSEGDLPVNPTPASTGLVFGMKIGDFPAAERNTRHFEGDEGIEVFSVDQDSFAEKIGLQPNDIVLSINRRPVRSTSDFLQGKALIQEGDAVALRVARATVASGVAGANPRWNTMLLSGTASSAAEALRASYENAQLAEQPATETPLQLPPVPRRPTWRERLGSILGQLQYPSQAQPLGFGSGRCSVGPLIGVWGDVVVADRLQGIDVSLRFNPDGTYDYFAGQGNAPWISHSGVYQLSETGDQRYPCKVTFNPDRSTMQVLSPYHLFVLRSRDLLDDQPRTFLYKFFPNANHLMLAGTWTDWHNDIGSVGLNRR